MQPLPIQAATAAGDAASTERPVLRAARARRLVVLTALLTAVVLGLRPWLGPAWSTPGSTPLYVLGVIGALLCLTPFAFAVAKRRADRSNAPAWFVAHALAGCAGTGVLVVHSGLRLDGAPALLLLCAIVLVAQGLWARTVLPRQQAARFASRHQAFLGPVQVDRVRLAEVIAAKRAALPVLDAAADEALFSLRPVHWLRRPLRAWGYAALVREERALIGQHAALPGPERLWRRLHIALAALFLAGLIVHVVTVTLFAGYVADGGPITWWHLAAWGGPAAPGG